MSSFSRAYSNEKLSNPNETKKSTKKSSLSGKSSINPQLNVSSQLANHDSISNDQLSHTNVNYLTSNQSNTIFSPTNVQTNQKLNISISPSLSLVNSNQSSATSSVNSLVDNQEELTNLTNLVKNFREELSNLRRIINNEINMRKDNDISKGTTKKEISSKETYTKMEKELSKNQLKDERFERQEILKAEVHDKLADVLRILKIIFERFIQIQSVDLFLLLKNLIEAVKGFPYDDLSANLNDLLDKIDQLAASFSNRVSDYLMDGNCLSVQCSQPKSKSATSFDTLLSQCQISTRYVCDNNNNNLNRTAQPLISSMSLTENNEFFDVNIWNSVYNMFHRKFADTLKKEDSTCDMTQTQLSSDECDEIIQRMNSSVEFALQNAKLWSKYTKDIAIYIEKRINFEMENSKNILKLAQTMRLILKESQNLPLQQLYLNMLDLDIKNHKAYFANNSLILGHKFCEPLAILRNENEKCRKACKSQWNREFKKLQDSVNNLKKSRSTYIAKKIELDRAKLALKSAVECSGSATSSYNLGQSANQTNSISSYIQATNIAQSLVQTETSSEQLKLDKKRKCEEDALQKAIDAESIYRNAVNDANERARRCENVKRTILSRIRDLDYKSDLTFSSVTGNYLQIQKLVTSAEPVDFQQLQKELENCSFGCTNFSDYLAKLSDSNQDIFNYFTFVPYETTNEFVQPVSMSFEQRNSDYESQTELTDFDASGEKTNLASIMNSNSSKLGLYNLQKHDSIIGEELDNETLWTGKNDIIEQAIHHQISKRKTKVAQTHHFRTVRTLSKCKECDIMNFQVGLECVQCGICVHKKCVDTLIIRCGYKPLTKRKNIFTLDLCNQSDNNEVPFIVKKCIQEINKRGLCINGLYRVSGVKSQVEKLCADFEIGNELVDLTTISPTVLTSVLKFYFRALPIPLLTFRLYNDFIQIGKRYPSIKSDINSSVNDGLYGQSLLKELRNLLNKLPEVHLNTLDYLMKHLKKVADNESNNMPANNLGIVFGPTLLRENESTTSLSSLVDTVHQNRVIELLILNYNELFGGNLVDDDDNDTESDEIIEEVKTIALDDESENDEGESANVEIQFDDLIQNLNENEFKLSKENVKHNFKPCSASKSQDSMDKKSSNEPKFSYRPYASRPSLQELRKQFFTETTSCSNLFQSLGNDELIDKCLLKTDAQNLKNTGKLDTRSVDRINSRSEENTEIHDHSRQSIKKSPESTNSSTLQFLKAKDEQHERLSF